MVVEDINWMKEEAIDFLKHIEHVDTQLLIHYQLNSK